VKGNIENGFGGEEKEEALVERKREREEVIL